MRCDGRQFRAVDELGIGAGEVLEAGTLFSRQVPANDQHQRHRSCEHEECEWQADAPGETLRVHDRVRREESLSQTSRRSNGAKRRCDGQDLFCQRPPRGHAAFILRDIEKRSTRWKPCATRHSAS